MEINCFYHFYWKRQKVEAMLLKYLREATSFGNTKTTRFVKKSETKVRDIRSLYFPRCTLRSSRKRTAKVCRASWLKKVYYFKQNITRKYTLKTKQQSKASEKSFVKWKSIKKGTKIDKRPNPVTVRWWQVCVGAQIRKGTVSSSGLNSNLTSNQPKKNVLGEGMSNIFFQQRILYSITLFDNRSS